MNELPEAVALSKQIATALSGKEIETVTVLQSPHKWAWFYGDPADYPGLLAGKTIIGAESSGGMIEILLDDVSLLFYDGINLRFCESEGEIPKKHQLLLRFGDGTFLCGSVQMYGGVACFEPGAYENKYYLAAREAPSPLSDDFTESYFSALLTGLDPSKLSAKAFLATEQRVPGLGNGVLQDILFNAGVHPRRKMADLDDSRIKALYESMRGTLTDMTERGGRDTERDLFGQPGGYTTLMSRNTVDSPCPKCRNTIEKASFGGGSVYFCPKCQEIS